VRRELKSIGIGLLLLDPLPGFAQTPLTNEHNKPILKHQDPLPTPQPAQTPRFVFHLDSFQIMDTRSYHEDTVVAGIGVMVNGAAPQTITHQLGNFNNGNINFQKKGLNPVSASIGPNDTFVFMFQLYNNGAHHNPNADELEAYLDKDLLHSKTYIAPGGYAFGSASATPGWSVIFPNGKGGAPNGEAAINDIMNVVSGGAFSSVKGIFEGCDGPLAFGLIAGTGAELNSRIAPQGPLRIAADFKGTQLKLGAPCNHAGSHYAVNVVIERSPASILNFGTIK
jgi:hypothetical protein